MNFQYKNLINILAIAGPTASQKSALALRLAEILNGVIINCDSKQIYRELPVLTSQPSLKDQAQAEHLLYGYKSVAKRGSVVDWVQLADQEIACAISRGRLPIIVGGSGLYFNHLFYQFNNLPEVSAKTKEQVRSLTQNLNLPQVLELLATIDPESSVKDYYRAIKSIEIKLESGRSITNWIKDAPPPSKRYSYKVILILPERSRLYDTINRRALEIINNGALEEAENIAKLSLDENLPALKVCGLLDLIAFLEGQMTLDQATQKMQQSTRNYAKRQITWFKHQICADLKVEDPDEALDIIRNRGFKFQ